MFLLYVRSLRIPKEKNAKYLCVCVWNMINPTNHDSFYKQINIYMNFQNTVKLQHYVLNCGAKML